MRIGGCDDRLHHRPHRPTGHPDQTGLDPALSIPLLRLLASGNPVELTTLATVVGREAPIESASGCSG
ncbi:hypothetical protein [Mycobacterium sp. Lab-001]|uniref:hypothetical protein n=1 Tax=Mycobacterium sp. Lab-001 TaxID=3410136 RepID=UPI003D1746E8